MKKKRKEKEKRKKKKKRTQKKGGKEKEKREKTKMAPAGFCKAEVEQEDGPASLPPGEYPSRHLSSGQCFKPASESFHII